jgi:hypothetical protein
MKSRCLVSFSDVSIEFYRGDGSFGKVPVEPGMPPEKVAALVDNLLKSNGCLDDELVYGIPSPDVFFIASLLDPVAFQSVEALRFVVEEKLPIDAEEMIPLVVEGRSRKRVLVWRIGAQRDLLVHLKEEYGIAFSAFIPTELLVATELMKQERLGDSETFISVNRASTDFVSFVSGELTQWNCVFGLQPENLEIENGSGTQILLADEVDVDSVPELHRDSVMELTRSSCLVNSLSGRGQNLQNHDFDFIDRLDFEYSDKHSVWEPLLLATFFLLMVVGGVLLYRSLQFRNQATEIEASIVSRFQSTLPDRRINGAVEKLLQEELKLQERTTSLLSHSTTSMRLLKNLESLVAASPDQIRFQFDSINLRASSVTISGEVKNFDDFQTLKKAFSGQGFQVQPGSKFAKPFSLTLTQEPLGSKEKPPREEFVTR